MSEYYENLAQRMQQKLQGSITDCKVALHELTVVVSRQHLLDVCRVLRDDEDFYCEQLSDLCGVDYSEYGNGSWHGERFAVVYHLLSIRHNHRIRLKVFTGGEVPVVDSVTGIWSVADWFEREAFDLFGIVFDGHPDLRRILTDYGFIGHPFRKDFPVTGHVAMRYDEEQGRVVYEPVEIEPRTLVPRIIRHDHRYMKPVPPATQGSN